MSGAKRRVCLVTDAWVGQVNGVVTTLTGLVAQLEDNYHNVDIVEPSQFKTFPMPSYPEIKVPWNIFSIWKSFKIIKNADKVHIATEGMLGFLARLYCHKHKIKYVTSYHTKFPEYIKARFPFIPEELSYSVMRWMHNRAAFTLVTTKSMKKELAEQGIKNTIIWSRGVDVNLFRPIPEFQQNKEVTIGYVGRVSIEKNLEAFLKLPHKAYPNKIVVGDGPDRKRLEKKYPNVRFVGYAFAEELVQWYNKLDVMVFPSRSDTFGLVLLESMACGTPVAAYPVTGPKDIITQGVNGYTDSNLLMAVSKCTRIDRALCREHVISNFSYDASYDVYNKKVLTIPFSHNTPPPRK